jgi:hypothetical protein
MKTYIPYSFLAAAAACGMALGQTAYTTPVGYTTSTVYAAFGAGSPKNNVVAPNLQNSASWAGSVGSISGDVLTLSDASLQAAAYNEISTNFSLGTVYAYFIETSDGYWAQIVSNSATTVTVEAGAGANFTAGEAVKIRKHVTIASYFGANNEAGLLPNNDGDPGEADNITIIDEVNSSSILVFPSNLLGGSWITDAFEEAANIPIYPDQGLQVLRRGLTDVVFTSSGEVNVTGRQIGITSGIQIRPTARPVDGTIGDLGLYTGVDSTGLADDGGTVDPAEADTVQVLVNGNTITYFYSTVDLGAGPGWYDDGFAPAENLPAGAALIINRTNPRNSGSFSGTLLSPIPTL